MITTITDREREQAAEIERLSRVVTAWSVTVETLEAERDNLQDTVKSLVSQNIALRVERDALRVERDALRVERDALAAANRDLQDWYDAAIADAKRFDWLTEDLDTAHGRVQRNQILNRMPSMSYSAACTAIDAAMKETNHDGSTE